MRQLITAIVILISFSVTSQRLHNPGNYYEMSRQHFMKPFKKDDRQSAILEATRLLMMNGFNEYIDILDDSRVCFFESVMCKDMKHVIVVYIFHWNKFYEVNILRLKNKDTALFSYLDYDGVRTVLMYDKR